ncbi:hypothetical protein DDB_G0284505 [Dictyostelium discoideum AX4]|uniref:Fucosyltransferase n=1 Tax=Dictyostelium discoideum TaxID=44689 RepID=Q54PJ9_DICDI|nr:hypothetical protein DDB_G0284505 [Dictyostelium discoideum AX4]EAL65179.1 hypothetical protein DDB_G0284505 [Dictyostelium discoideum AX4]|eukprot:XP_638533.1 hypothetical protein DDB_G0284505 [Dictyostelium discoideum AX4]
MNLNKTLFKRVYALCFSLLMIIVSYNNFYNNFLGNPGVYFYHKDIERATYGNYYNNDAKYHNNSNKFNVDNDDPYKHTNIEGEGVITRDAIKELNISNDQYFYFKYIGRVDTRKLDRDTIIRCKGLDDKFYYIVRKPYYPNQKLDMEIWSDYIVDFEAPKKKLSSRNVPRTLISMEPQPNRTCEFDKDCFEFFNFKVSFESQSDIRMGFDTPSSSAYKLYNKLTIDEIAKIQTQFKLEYQVMKHNNTLQPHQKSIPLANWFCTNCNSHSNRNEYVQELMKFIVVDSFGKCLKNMPTSNFLSRGSGDPFERKRLFITRYKFTIVFENSICKDYVSEKVLDALIAGSVPIFMGHPSTIKYLPLNSYIFVGDFKNAEHLANHLKFLSENDNEYFKLHTWRTNQTVIDQWKGVNNYPNKPGFRFREVQCPILRHYQRLKTGKIPLKKLKYKPMNQVCLPSNYYKIK